MHLRTSGHKQRSVQGQKCTAGWMSHSDIHSRPPVRSALSTFMADNDLCPVLIQSTKSTG